MKIRDHQCRGNLFNECIRRIHTICLVCGKPAEDGAHIYQKDKRGRLAELAKGNHDVMYEKHAKIVFLCHSCNSRHVKNLPQDEMSLLQRILKIYNNKHDGIEYYGGLRKWIFDTLFDIHGPDRLIHILEEDYNRTIKTLTMLAQKDLAKLRKKIKGLRLLEVQYS